MFRTKRKIEMYDFYDVRGMKNRLEAMAQQGWMISKINRKVWTYKKIEPQKIHFSVTHFANYSNSEAEPDRGQAEFIEMCAASGWQLAVQYNSLFVFVNYSDNPIPLETDAVTQVENIDNAMKTEFDFDRSHMLIILVLFPLIRAIMDLGSGTADLVENPTGILMFFIIAAYIVMFIIERFNYKLWHKKAMAMAQETGRFVPVQKSRQPIAMLVEALIVLFISEMLLYSFDPIFLMGVYISLALASAVYFYADRVNKFIRLLAGAVVIALSALMMYTAVAKAGFTPVEIKYKGEEHMPVSMEKLGITPTNDNYISEHSEFKCFLYDRYEGNQEYLQDDINMYVPDFSYTLIKVKSAGFYNSLKRDYMGDLTGNSNTELEYWKAESTQNNAHRITRGHYTYHIYYTDKILILRTSVILSNKQISTVVTELVEKYA